MVSSEGTHHHTARQKRGRRRELNIYPKMVSLIWLIDHEERCSIFLI